MAEKPYNPNTFRAWNCGGPFRSMTRSYPQSSKRCEECNEPLSPGRESIHVRLLDGWFRVLRTSRHPKAWFCSNECVEAFKQRCADHSRKYHNGIDYIGFGANMSDPLVFAEAQRLNAKAEERQRRLTEGAIRDRKIAAGDLIDYRSVYKAHGFTCHICGYDIDRTKHHPHPLSPSIDHVVPLAGKGEHVIENVKPAHLYCNMAKRTGHVTPSLVAKCESHIRSLLTLKQSA